MRNQVTYSVTVAVLILIAILYWPVMHAGFVWDDILDFVDMGWLTHGDDWKHYIFKDFNDWVNYFRPLGVALFTLQVRLFNDTPGPMHAVSLAMHLIDTLLVGLLSWRCSQVVGYDAKRSTWLLAASMLIYGLHPVMIEGVVWIGCQFDLAVTMFMLLGLLSSVSIQNASVRAIVVALLFFLAACSKEAAAPFPLMLLVFEWALLPRGHEAGLRSAIYALIKRNWQTFVAMFIAGAAYLAFRHWALGQFINPAASTSSPIFERLQETSFIYLQYWKMLLWPMQGINPIHVVSTQRFYEASLTSLIIDATAVGIVITSLYLALKRSSPIGCIVVMMTVALFPVLHILSIAFAPSLYHERYVMSSLATICAMIPLIRISIPISKQQMMLIRLLTGIVACLWFALAILNIRSTLPLWSNNVKLWQWALTENPDSINAKDDLLSAYIDSKDYTDADRLVTQLLAQHVPCANCMLNAAILAISEGDPTRAATELEEVRKSRQLVTNKQMLRVYLLTVGQMLVLQGHLEDAEGTFRAAMNMDPLDPQPRLSLATALAMQGNGKEAREVGDSGIALLSPDKRDAARRRLDHAINMSIKPPQQLDQATDGR